MTILIDELKKLLDGATYSDVGYDPDTKLKVQPYIDDTIAALGDELSSWDSWYPDLFSNSENGSAKQLEETGWTNDASLYRDWLKPFRNNPKVVGDERNRRPELYGAVEDYVKEYFDAGIAPRGVDFRGVVDTVFWRLVSWKTWYPRFLEWSNDEEDDYDFGPDAYQQQVEADLIVP